MPLQADIEIWSGNDVVLNATIGDGAGGVKDLTGALAIIWVLAKAEGGTPILTRDLGAGIAVTAPATLGKFVVTLTPTETEALVGKGKVYYHECRVTDSAGKKSTVFWGSATVRGNSITT